MGARVRSIDSTTGIEFEIDELPSGIYVLIAQSKSGTEVIKFEIALGN